VYAAVGIGLTGLALHASRLIAGGPTDRYPYGREALSPLVIALQGVAMLAICAYGSVDAVLTIVDGGSDVIPSSALWYGMLSLVAAVAGWAWLRPRGLRSELLAAEAQAWLVGAGLSVGMIVAFGLVLLMNRAGNAHWGRFADPVLVLIASAALTPAPVRMIRRTLTELLEGAPGTDIHDLVRRALAEVRDRTTTVSRPGTPPASRGLPRGRRTRPAPCGPRRNALLVADGFLAQADPLDRDGLGVHDRPLGAQGHLVLRLADLRTVVGIPGVRIGNRLTLKANLFV
jgi:hypothetical protein